MSESKSGSRKLRVFSIVGVLLLAGAVAGLAYSNHSNSAPLSAHAPKGAQNPEVPTGKTALPRAMARVPEVPPAERLEVTNERIYNQEAPIPPQCYTKTESTHNPCYTCHQSYDAETDQRINQVGDGGLQGEYGFSDVGLTNHWSNLFVDRREWLEQIPDELIDEYVAEDNYSDLRQRLEEQKFSGYLPDLKDYQDGAVAFDERGLAKDGSGWVAYNYKPFPGTFWPTNGATDDVLIRLPEAFRQVDGEFSRDAYYVNLTLIELNLKEEDQLELWPIDEQKLGVDLDGDGKQTTATVIKSRSRYVGDASDAALAFQQFPTGTEFLHSVRYLGVGKDGSIHLPRRMKELRYMRKVNTFSSEVLDARYARERKEKRMGQVPNYLSRGDEGFDNALGWFVSGFIEDYEGELRPQTHEEGVFCMGCHTGIGTTMDSTFSFARKVPGGQGWRYIDLLGMPDVPSKGEPDEGEILAYLKRAGGGSEFRENEEMRERWFKDDGTVDEAKVREADVYTLLAPSPRRAHDLNKAYLHIVRHQSYRLGRDPTWAPARNVIKEVDDRVEPLSQENRFLGWELRLSWAKR